jgi:hypothetical protein
VLPAAWSASLRDGDEDGAGSVGLDADDERAGDLPAVSRLLVGVFSTDSCSGCLCGEPAGCCGAGALLGGP